MNRLQTRIADCQELLSNLQMEKWGLNDAALGTAPSFTNQHYMRGYTEGQVLRALDEQERSNGHDQSGVTADVCHEAHQC